ncbi:hypothetical protein K461DRAFT_292180 [Myriangium duriaei CBS 260.36]|uniref:AA1-like domain-containing protein n=1 Tax=Myriangium duriaei CBS 260.36 TaxID=1168546 RepID=A0A9P4MHX2_9PEZI|nr:hypothetical protein K461DRAFT_292180 [Myriangium duriaei CBS 260.36]
MKFELSTALLLAAATSFAAPARQLLDLVQVKAAAAAPSKFYFEVTDLVTHAASTKRNSTDQNTLKFTVNDASYTGPNGTAKCSISWDPKGGEFDYYNPTYNFCDNNAFGFRINNGTLKNITTFELEIQHTYETAQSAPWYYTYFATLDTSDKDFHCKTSRKGTDCKEKGGPLIANITAAIG